MRSDKIFVTLLFVWGFLFFTGIYFFSDQIRSLTGADYGSGYALQDSYINESSPYNDCQYDHYSRKDASDIYICNGSERDHDNLIETYSPDRVIHFKYNASRGQQLAGIKDHCSNGVKRIDYGDKERAAKRYNPEEITIDVFCNVPAPAPASEKLTADEIK